MSFQTRSRTRIGNASFNTLLRAFAPSRRVHKQTRACALALDYHFAHRACVYIIRCGHCVCVSGHTYTFNFYLCTRARTPHGVNDITPAYCAICASVAIARNGVQTRITAPRACVHVPFSQHFEEYNLICICILDAVKHTHARAHAHVHVWCVQKNLRRFVVTVCASII